MHHWRAAASSSVRGCQGRAASAPATLVERRRLTIWRRQAAAAVRGCHQLPRCGRACAAVLQPSRRAGGARRFKARLGRPTTRGSSGKSEAEPLPARKLMPCSCSGWVRRAVGATERPKPGMLRALRFDTVLPPPPPDSALQPWCAHSLRSRPLYHSAQLLLLQQRRPQRQPPPRWSGAAAARAPPPRRQAPSAKCRRLLSPSACQSCLALK